MKEKKDIEKREREGGGSPKKKNTASKDNYRRFVGGFSSRGTSLSYSFFLLSTSQ